MDYEYLENPDIQNLKGHAADALDSAFNVVDQLSGLLSAILGFAAISSLIVMLNPLVILMILLVIFLNSLITKRLSKKTHLTDLEIENNGRREWGASYMLDNLYFAKETRIFNLVEMLLNLYLNVKDISNQLVYKNQKDRNNAGMLQALINVVKDVVIYGYLIVLVLTNSLAIGTMSIYLNAANQFSSNLTNVVNSYLNLTRSSLRIRELIKFMNLPLKQYESGTLTPKFDRNSVIEFKNVSFKYPGSERYAIRNLNVIIRGDEKLCIVGENGAGKSTFIKLLTRLYFPSEGEILLNGININEYDYEKWQRLFAPVFQDFVKYYMSFGENIVLNNIYDTSKLDDICKDCGLDELVNKLPKRYETSLDKWIDEDGFEPSGGEMQRIAIARACYHGGDIYLLDEPTAALDPRAEYDVYAQFNDMITDKCAVLITHRLSAVQLADKVAVFDSGNIVEYGTHCELLSNNGIYAEMFNKQAEFYKNNID